MDKGFTEALAAFWDKRADTLALESNALDTEVEKALNKLTVNFPSEMMDAFMDAEDAMNRRDALVKELFYKAGFRDAVRFLLCCCNSTTV
jgi:site-specific recombinase XerC